MMNGLEKSDSLIVPMKLANKAGLLSPLRSQGGKRWDREECESAKHGPNSESGSRVPGAGQHTCSWCLTAARHLLAIGAVCGNSARTDLCGGRPAMGVPTAILGRDLPFRRDAFDRLSVSAQRNVLIIRFIGYR
jgi:hypothetical protein